MRKAAAVATGDWVRLRKARDFHRLHHKRVGQEKDKLLADMKRLRTHYAQYEPVIRDLRAKYEATTREATRVRLERDRLAQQLALAEEQAGSRGGGGEDAQEVRVRVSVHVATWPSHCIAIAFQEPRVQRIARTTSDAARSQPSGDTAAARGAAAAPPAPAPAPSGPRSAGVPTGRLPNPYRDVVFEPARVAQYVQLACMTSSSGEDGATSGAASVTTSSVAAVAIHPTKPVCATGCDDTTWGLWALPGGERLMCGEGHDQWVSTVAFHPGGGQLASGSGDGTVKLWSLGQRKCVATLGGESKGAAVWSVAYHDGGATVAAACLDKHARLWDLATGKCVLTLRGHGDSVNDVAWQPFGSGIATAGSDRSLIVWDTRTGLPSLTLSGHTAGVHSLAWALAADVLASCDGDGTLRLWDVRTGGATATCSTGTAALNRVAFERSGALLAAGSDDGSIKCVAVAPATATPLRVEATLKGHTEAVQAVAWDPRGEFLLSGSSDGTLRLWGVPPPPPPPPSRSGTAMSHRSAMPVA